MVFSYNWLQSFFQKKLPAPNKLAELLTIYSFEVGEVKKNKGDFSLDIEVMPNRAGDCFSHIGITREISAILNWPFKAPASIKTSKGKESFITVEVKDKRACPRYTAKVLTEVKVGPSPKWLQDQLRVCGLNSINNVVDIANYVMLETGQPLHAFDGEKLAGKKIIVRLAKDREKIVTLDEQKFDLDPNILVIADARAPIAIAGIKGGKLPEIDKKTKVVVLESANFDPRVIRKGSKRLSLKTDASLRFEHGLDANLTELAINRAAYLMQKIARGKVAQGLIDVYPQKVYPKRIKLDLNYLERLLGVKIPAKEIKSILSRLGFQIKGSTVIIPTFRRDMAIPEDLIEEIGRIYGYEKIPAVFPIASLVPAKRNEEVFWEDMAKNILKEAGFSEAYNYSFISENDAKAFGVNSLIELANPMSDEQKYLRPSLIPNLLKNVQKNQKHFDKIKIFELGKVFEQNQEKRELAGILTGDAFYQVKGIIDLLLNKLGVSNIWYGEGKIPFCHPKKCAEVKVNNTKIGFLGEMRGVDKIVVFDLDFDKLQKLVSEEHQYMPLSKFPSAVRDLAILVPRQTKVVQVLNKINAAGGKLVRDVDLFDIYEGEELPQGKKNLAFHIIYQSETKTLKSKEVDEIHQKIIKTLEKEPTWQVRK